MVTELPCDAFVFEECPCAGVCGELNCATLSRSQRRKQRVRKIAVRKAKQATDALINPYPFLKSRGEASNMKALGSDPYNSAQSMQPLSQTGDGLCVEGSGSVSAEKTLESILSRLEEK